MTSYEITFTLGAAFGFALAVALVKLAAILSQPKNRRIRR